MKKTKKTKQTKNKKRIQRSLSLTTPLYLFLYDYLPLHVYLQCSPSPNSLCASFSHLVGPKGAREDLDSCESLQDQHARCHVGSLTRVAGNDDTCTILQALLELGVRENCLAHFLQLHVQLRILWHKWQGSTGHSARRTDVEEAILPLRVLSRLDEVNELQGCDGVHQAIHDVAGHHTSEVHGVACSSERRSIAQLEVLKVSGRHVPHHGSGNDVDALLDTVLSHGLSSPDLAVVGVKDQLQVNEHAVRVEFCVLSGVQVDSLVRQALGLQELLAHPRRSGRGAPELHTVGADGAQVGAGVLLAHDVLGADAALSVSRATQGHGPGLLTAHGAVLHLDGVANSPDAGIRDGAHALVHLHVAPRGELDARGLHEASAGAHAQGQNHHVSLEALAGLQDDVRDLGALRRLLEGCNAIIQVQVHALLPKQDVQVLGHLPVQRRHHLVHGLHDAHLEGTIH
mmetsp:Transcript_31817/g.47567  ORF Transcript_31817/g.47567 Transcript_31817/m.47567 type:complete len:457 (+) Transcript_31817:79-1449(+)